MSEDNCIYLFCSFSHVHSELFRKEFGLVQPVLQSSLEPTLRLNPSGHFRIKCHRKDASL